LNNGSCGRDKDLGAVKVVSQDSSGNLRLEKELSNGFMRWSHIETVLKLKQKLNIPEKKYLARTIELLK
jgi:hypothetical protein